MIVERISGDAPPDYFIGPSWCLDKPAVKRAIEAEFDRRDTFQGANGMDGITDSGDRQDYETD